MKLITDTKALTTAINSIASRGKKLEADIHVAACSCLHHADAHNNADPMLRLLAALPNLARKNALIAWAQDFGKFTVNEEGTGLAYDKTKSTDLEAAQAKPFWEYKPEAPFKAFDLQAELARLLKRADAALKQDDERNNVDIEMLSRIRAAGVERVLQ